MIWINAPMKHVTETGNITEPLKVMRGHFEFVSCYKNLTCIIIKVEALCRKITIIIKCLKWKKKPWSTKTPWDFTSWQPRGEFIRKFLTGHPALWMHTAGLAEGHSKSDFTNGGVCPISSGFTQLAWRTWYLMYLMEVSVGTQFPALIFMENVNQNKLDKVLWYQDQHGSYKLHIKSYLQLVLSHFLWTAINKVKTCES